MPARFVERILYCIGIDMVRIHSSIGIRQHRPRNSREDGAALRYLADWRRRVERLERGTGHRQVSRRWEWTGPTGCPMCDGELEEDPRGHLEALIRNGGRRAHRLAVQVEFLDNRFRAVTVESERPRAMSWWLRRVPWA